MWVLFHSYVIQECVKLHLHVAIEENNVPVFNTLRFKLVEIKSNIFTFLFVSKDLPWLLWNPKLLIQSPSATHNLSV